MVSLAQKGDRVRLSIRWIVPVAVVALAGCGPSAETTTAESSPPQVETADIATLVGRLDLERYKATIKGLTQFGDRLHGTDRNRAAIDWIEAQLKSYGCATERFAYEYRAARSARPCPSTGNTGGQRSAARRRWR